MNENYTSSANTSAKIDDNHYHNTNRKSKADSSTDSNGIHGKEIVPLIPVIPMRVAPISYITNQDADNNGVVTLVGTGNDFDEVVVTGNARTAEGNQKQQRRMTLKKRESEYNI